MIFVGCRFLFQNHYFVKNSFIENHHCQTEVCCFVLAPDCLLIGLDLGPNCLQRLSADDKS